MIPEPIDTPTSLKELRPTQITVGMQGVKEKRRQWREKHGKKAGKFLACAERSIAVGSRLRVEM